MMADTDETQPPTAPAHCILLVEDDADDAALAKRALARTRIANEVVHLPDGETARDYLFGLGEWATRDVTCCPELILLDLKLPRMSGLELLQRLRAHDATRLVPVVVLTSSPDEEDIARSYGLGANSYVRKPVDYSAFRKAIDDLAMYWLVVNQSPTNKPGGRGEGKRAGIAP